MKTAWGYNPLVDSVSITSSIKLKFSSGSKLREAQWDAVKNYLSYDKTFDRRMDTKNDMIANELQGVIDGVEIHSPFPMDELQAWVNAHCISDPSGYQIVMSKDLFEMYSERLIPIAKSQGLPISSFSYSFKGFEVIEGGVDKWIMERKCGRC